MSIHSGLGIRSSISIQSAATRNPQRRLFSNIIPLASRRGVITKVANTSETRHAPCLYDVVHRIVLLNLG
jgi:hypothetical protein